MIFKFGLPPYSNTGVTNPKGVSFLISGNNILISDGFTCLSDWLSFTDFVHSSPDDIIEYLGLDFCDFSLSRGASGYRLAYRHCMYDISVLFDGSSSLDDMGIHVDVTGSAVPYLLERYSVLHDVESSELYGSVLASLFTEILQYGKFSRIDIALDDKTGKFFSVNDVFESYDNGLIVSKFKSFRKEVSGDACQNITGSTFYCGSRKSDSFLRIYDKKLEKKIEDSALSWVRWEFELKNDHATNFACLLVGGKSLSDLMLGLLRHYIRFIVSDNARRSRCSDSDLWIEFLHGVESCPSICSQPSEKSIDRIKNCLIHQWAPSIAVLYELEGYDFFYDIINAGRSRIRPELNRLLECEFDKLLKK